MSRREEMLEREKVANRKKHWVRIVTACNSRCAFCLDTDTPRNLYLPDEDVKAELRRGIEELDADKVIISGGEATLHPRFFEFIEYAKSIGYDRVQTVTNGTFLGDEDYYEKAAAAGLGEITWSLHGHTAELHDELTKTPGAFKKMTRGIARAVRDPRMITNVDVVICKPNVGVLDKIVELSIRLGVHEFDLLHVIPQAAAFENRDMLFYDPAEHLEVLHKVFRLNRHPRFVIWTNRFPVPFLEGLEDLVQDPHKMLDEVNGRRFMVRNYIDTGKALDCRQPERCVHCFIEPFCTTMDRTIQAQNDASFEVWDAADGGPTLEELPYGCSRLGVRVDSVEELAEVAPPEGAGLYARVETPGPLPAGDHVVVADTTDKLQAWLPALPDGVQLDIHLTQAIALWLVNHRDLLLANLDRVVVHQPTHEHLADASENDVRNPAAFFRHLAVDGLRVSGLPACLAPGSVLTEARKILPAALFNAETGRVEIRPLARHHVDTFYLSKSLRCRTCRVADRCDGIHVNMIRDQGLKLADPLIDGAWADDAEDQLTARWPTPPTRVEQGAPPLSPAPSLPGFAEASGPVLDPLAVVARDKQKKRAARRAALQVLPRGDA
jgi:MoaA/NifB/PqqE/SkfB family radical SAM enzyme